jgi:UDP-N-acetylmuramoylalanine--D-glutamate ligase
MHGVRAERKYDKALVLGLGASGAAAATLLLSEGVAVTVVDQSENEGIAQRAGQVEAAGGRALCGATDLPEYDFEVCIISPGIAAGSTWVRSLVARGVPVIAELELGWQRCRCPVLAVTGTNGKSTLAKLCSEALGAAGRAVALAGNYGTPLCEVAPLTAGLDRVVVEVSSFQLETVRDFRPGVGVLLNVQPDHLDRHGDMDCYRGTKMKLFGNMTREDVGIVPRELAGDTRDGGPGLSTFARRGPRWVDFGLSEGADYRYEDGRVCFAGEDGNESIDLAGTMFANPLTGMTACAAVAAVSACGCGAAVVERAIRAFEPLPHRMTRVRRLGDVEFIDDSKATNLAALGAALRMCNRPVRLIAGGLLKETDLAVVEELLAKNARGVYLIGNAAHAMEEAWGGTVPCHVCMTLPRAVAAAWRDAQQGETILLSPGCASFDQFNGYEDRGNQFNSIVRSINEER